MNTFFVVLIIVLLAVILVFGINLLYQAIQVSKKDIKSMSLQERMKWTYPEWIDFLLRIEYAPDELMTILQGLPVSKIQQIKNAGLDHLVITNEVSQTSGFPAGVLVWERDLQKIILEKFSFSSTTSRSLDGRPDVRVVVAEASDPETRVELFLQNYLMDLRSAHTDAETKVNEKRRAFQETLSRLVKIARDESAQTLSTREAENSKERWAQKLYEDLHSHPDILRVDLQKQRGYIHIYTDDMVVEETGSLPRKESRSKKFFFLGKMIVKINLSSGETQYFHENGKMCSDSDHHAPHVNSSGDPCLGSHKGVVEKAVKNRNYLQAIQEAINFLKYANTADRWGESALKLRQLKEKEIEATERGKLKRAKKTSPTAKVTQLSMTSKYILPDKAAYRKILKSLKIRALPLDDSHNIGVTGLLIPDATNINLFVEQVIKSYETIRIDATAQPGVRQISFVVDEQRKLFVDLMMQSWEGREVNTLDILRKEREKIIVELQKNRATYMKHRAGHFKSKIEMTNDKIQQGLFSYLMTDIYRQLIALPDIASVDVRDDKLIIETYDLYVKEAKLRPRAKELRCYNLGKMRIEIDLSLRDEPIRCFRVDGAMPRSDGLLQAPHVDKDGLPIWGVQELRMIELLADFNIVAAVQETIKFLQVAKLDDAKGMYVQYLPEVDVLELPDLELSKKVSKEKILLEAKKKAEELRLQEYEKIILTNADSSAKNQ